jgi:hypothetical protein
VLGEVLAERPVLVEQRHADRRIRVEHLLGGDDLDLVRVDVEAELIDRDPLDRIIDATDGAEVPVRPLVEEAGLFRCKRHGAALTPALLRSNNSRKTG